MKASISIIGFGRLGKLLHKTLSKAGYDQISIIRSEDEILFLNDFVLITVPDIKVKSVINEIIESGLIVKGKTFSHCSGVLGLDVFTPFDRKNVLFGCIHPLMAITEKSVTFEGITFDVCGDQNYINKVSPLIFDLNALYLEVDEDQKAKLHLAAVLTSNYLVTLMGMANELFIEDELDQDQLNKALLPLMDSALRNIEHQTPSQALTGPIIRGDVETINRHLSLLKDHKELKLTYKKLGSETVRLLGDSLQSTIKLKLKNLFDEI